MNRHFNHNLFKPNLITGCLALPGLLLAKLLYEKTDESGHGRNVTQALFLALEHQSPYLKLS